MISSLQIRSVTSQFSLSAARTRSTPSRCSLRWMDKSRRCSEWRTNSINSASPKTSKRVEIAKSACSTRSSLPATARHSVPGRHQQSNHSPTSQSSSHEASAPTCWFLQSSSCSRWACSSLTSPSRTAWNWSQTNRRHALVKDFTPRSKLIHLSSSFVK